MMRTADVQWEVTHCMGDAAAAVTDDVSNALLTTLQGTLPLRPSQGILQAAVEKKHTHPN
jgi:hypothetical protein